MNQCGYSFIIGVLTDGKDSVLLDLRFLRIDRNVGQYIEGF